MKKKILLIITLIILSFVFEIESDADQSLSNLILTGDRLLKEGKKDEALKKYSEALSYIDNHPEADTESYINLNSQIGDIYILDGDYNSALFLYEKQLKNSTAHNIPLSQIYALNNSGSIYYKCGIYNKSIECREKALEIARKNKVKNRFIASIINNLGVAYNELKNDNKALNCYFESLKLTKEFDPENSQRLISIYSNIASIYIDNKKNFNEGLNYLNKARLLAIESGNEQKLSVIYYNMAHAYLGLANKTEFNRIIKDSIKISREINDRENLFMAEGLLGLQYLLTKQYREAIPCLSEAADIIDSIWDSVPDNLKNDYLNKEYDIYTNLILAYINNNDMELFPEALRRKESVSSRYLSWKLNKRFAANNIRNDPKNLYRKFISELHLNNKTSVISFGSYSNFPPICSFYISNQTLAWSNIGKASNDFINAVNNKFGNDIKNYLKNEYKSNNTRGFSIVSSSKPSDNSINFDVIIRYYRSKLISTDKTSITVSREIGKMLYNTLLGNLTKVTGFDSKEELIIIPDGILCFIPFETLVTPDNRYLCEKYTIRYCQSLAILNTLNNREYNKSRKSVLAFGGAVYDTEKYQASINESDFLTQRIKDNVQLSLNRSGNLGNAFNLMGISWNNLPGTLTEVKLLKDLFPDSDVFTGDMASESKVKDMSGSGKLKKYKAIHFATHGMVVPEIPEMSSIVLSLNNKRNGNDGYLNMNEIAQLDLNADFVNLSACETGLGKIYYGEGVVGLTQSFLLAGANGISVSLWQVSDEATMEFMSGLYRLVKDQGVNYNIAISMMKRNFINGKYKEPFYWAPFVYYGK